jgi:hypothetical protein
MNSSRRDELMQLCDAVCNGQVDGAELRRLESLVCPDRESRAFYVEYMNLHGQLKRRFRGEQHVQAAPSGDTAAETLAATTPLEAAADYVRHLGATMNTPSSISILVAAFTTLALIFILAMVFVPSAVETPGADSRPLAEASVTPIVRVIETQNCRWAAGQGPLMHGDRLAAGARVRIESGRVALLAENGVYVALEGPVDYEIASVSHSRLYDGALVAYVPSSGRGFSVETDSAAIVDHGTQFRVVADGAATEVIVYQGAVDVTPKSDGKKPEAKRLVAGESVRVDRSGESIVTREQNNGAAESEALPADVVSISTPYARSILADEPIAYFPFDEPSEAGDLTCFGSVAGEGQGRGKIAFEGTARFAAVGPRGEAFPGLSPRNLAVAFDGSKDGLRLSDLPAVYRGGGATLEFWFLLKSDQTSQSLCGFQASPAHRFILATSYRPDSPGGVVAYFKTSVGQNTTPHAAVKTGKWIHLAQTWDNRVGRLYLDGKLVAEKPEFSAGLSPSEGFFIGKTIRPSDPRFLDGAIDELAIYDQAIEPKRIAAHFHAATAPTRAIND